VERTVQVRLGGFAQHAKKKNWRNFPTANGTYTVYDKQRNPRSENYGAGAMPYSIMFHPDMYVHYSSGFAKQGYDSSSHGCVNVGDKDAILWLYEHTPIGATVHVF
jgi:lipoprotein-anchoring transpeptidase ErfK/SrfK